MNGTRLAMLVLMTGIGSAWAQSSSKAIDAAYEQAMACLGSAADRLDDNQSDARTIATAISADCRAAQRKVIALRRNLPDDHPNVAEAMAVTETKAWWLDRATVIALERRAERRRR